MTNSLNLMIDLPMRDVMLTHEEDAVRKRVIVAREANGLTREELARKLSLEYQSYSHYERGRFAFTVEQLFQLARILGYPIAYLLGEETGLKEDEEHVIGMYRALRDRGSGLTVVDFMESLLRHPTGR
jgi:transcriptional regulator with XRE-family HTH domain